MAEKEEEQSKSSIVIKLISGEDLRAFNFFQKLSVFALVSIASDEPTKAAESPQKQRTPTDRENDGSPEWNHEIRFLLDAGSDSDLDHLFVRFDLRHEGLVFGIGDRTIGEVRIPVKDLVDEASSNGVVRFARYQVKGSDGKPNGVLNLSYRFDSMSRKTLISYPKVEQVPNLDLIDSTLSYYYSSRFDSNNNYNNNDSNNNNNDNNNGNGLFWSCPSQTTPFQPPYHHHYHHSLGFGGCYRHGENW